MEASLTDGSASIQHKERRAKMDFEGYCMKCRKRREVKDGQVVQTSKGRPMAKGTCPECGTTVTRFLSAEEAEGK
jgi:hypothetical protein